MSNSVKAKLGVLTSLRFFAAAGVVLYHFAGGLDSPFPFYSRLHMVASYGNLGVPFFFMLSGYVLAYNYPAAGEGAQQITPSAFWWKRFARIYPLYLLARLVCVPFVIPRGVQMHGALGAMIKLPVTFLANVLLIHAWHMHLNGEWNGASWSLSDEAFFYLMFPLLIRKLSWVQEEQRWKLAAAKCALWLLVCWSLLAASDHAIAAGSHFFYFLMYNPLVNFTLFVTGAVLCLLGRRLVRDAPELFRLSTRIAMAVVLLAVVDVAFNAGLPGLPRAFGSILFAALLWLGGAGVPARASSWLSWSPLLLLGEASYAVYLLQVPAFYYSAWLWSALRLGAYGPPTSSNPLFFLPFLLILLGVSILTFKSFEQPARRFLQRRRPWTWEPLLPGPPVRIPALSAIAVKEQNGDRKQSEPV